MSRWPYMPNLVYTLEGVTPITDSEWARVSAIAGIPPHASKCSALEWEAYRLSTRGRPAPGWDAGGYRPPRASQPTQEASE